MKKLLLVFCMAACFLPAIRKVVPPSAQVTDDANYIKDNYTKMEQYITMLDKY